VAIARDIHVDNLDGDNAFTGRHSHNTSDATGPVRTIARALERAATGDRIVLKNTGEPYRESVSLIGRRHSGYSFGWFTIEGNGAILDGSASVPLGAWDHYRGPVYRFRPPRLAHQQLFIDDRPAVQAPAGRNAKEPPELESLQWCLHGGYIYFSVEPQTPKHPQDYALTYTHHQAGITLYHVERVVVKDLTIQGFQLDGINLFNSARDVSVVGVTCRGNARNGITVGGASRVVINACLLGNNGAAQLFTLPWSETDVENSELLSNTAPAWVDRGGKVYVDGQRVEGGLDEPVAEASAQ
jgi:hypothetical protein